MFERVKEAFAEPPVEGAAAVYLFGSHAAGRAHHDSDVDIAVLDVDIAVLLKRAAYPSPSERFTARLWILSHLGARLGAAVDLVILNDAPPLLGRAITTQGRPVAIYDAAADHDYRRDVQLRAADIQPLLDRHREKLLAELTA